MSRRIKKPTAARFKNLKNKTSSPTPRKNKNSEKFSCSADKKTVIDDKALEAFVAIFT
jgi:hypothetical protein